MKAKQYASKYLQSDDKIAAAVDIARQFLDEITELADTRKVQSSIGLISICRELDQKWIKFAEIVNKKYPATQPIRYSGFRALVEKASLELYKLWNP